VSFLKQMALQPRYRKYKEGNEWHEQKPIYQFWMKTPFITI